MGRPKGSKNKKPAAAAAINPVKIKTNTHGGRRPGAGRKKQGLSALELVEHNPNLTDLQKKYVAARVEGKSKKDAAIEAGYSEKTSASIIDSDVNVQEAFRRLFNKVVSDQKLVDTIAAGLEANQTKFFTEKGVVIDEREVIDYSERREYTELAARVKQVILKEPDVLVNLGLFTGQISNMLPADWQDSWISNEVDTTTPSDQLPGNGATNAKSRVINKG